jgi:hypothetical protein
LIYRRAVGWDGSSARWGRIGRGLDGKLTGNGLQVDGDWTTVLDVDIRHHAAQTDERTTRATSPVSVFGDTSSDDLE